MRALEVFSGESPLRLLALDVEAALASYGAALAGGCRRRIEECRANLATAARALATWCDPGGEPEPHGARRRGGMPSPMETWPDPDREAARALAEGVRCRVCGGSGRRDRFDVYDGAACHACAGTGVES